MGHETVPNWWVNGKPYGDTEILQSLRSFRMTANELVILSEAKNLDISTNLPNWDRLMSHYRHCATLHSRDLSAENGVIYHTLNRTHHS